MVHDTISVELEIWLVVMDEITGPVLSTVTATAAEVAEFPAASRATATIECAALLTDVLSHVIEYGDDVSSVPTLVPSTLNCTPTTPILSEAVAESVTLAPETVAPFVGAVSETVGAVVSGDAPVIKNPGGNDGSGGITEEWIVLVAVDVAAVPTGGRDAETTCESSAIVARVNGPKKPVAGKC